MSQPRFLFTQRLHFSDGGEGGEQDTTGFQQIQTKLCESEASQGHRMTLWRESREGTLQVVILLRKKKKMWRIAVSSVLGIKGNDTLLLRVRVCVNGCTHTHSREWAQAFIYHGSYEEVRGQCWVSVHCRPPCLTWGFLFITVNMGSADPWASRDSEVSTSHVAIGTLRSQMHAAMPGLTWVLRIHTQFLKLSRKAFYPLSYNSSPVTSSFTPRKPSILSPSPLLAD